MFFKIYKVEYIHKKGCKNSYVTGIKELISYIFNYDKFNKGTKKWNRHLFICSLGIKICPYCNRNYITSYKYKNIKNTTANADHYYPKSLYPILQLNIFNMIPSCNVCNSVMKGDEDTRHLYPYKDKESRLEFSTNFKSINDLYNFNQNDIDIIPKEPNDIEAKGSLSVFKLKEVYQIHQDIIFNLKNRIKDYEVFKKNYYNVLYGDDISKNLFNGDKIFEYWFDFLNKDPRDEPLIKLKQDVYNQIKKSLV